MASKVLLPKTSTRMKPHKAAASPPTPPPVRIGVIEDYRSLADLLRDLCVRVWGHEIAFVASTGTAGLEQTAAHKPDILLCDLGLPDVDGVQVIARVVQQVPETKIIVLSSLCNDYTIHRLSEHKIHGFVDKISDGLPVLERAIQQVMRGHVFFSPHYHAVVHRLKRNPDSFHRLLSEREQEILVWIGNTLSDEEIGRLLNITPRTVETHRAAIMRKLDIHSTPKLIHYCTEVGLNSLHPFPAKIAEAREK
jgi:DNA-binding NarL/FixJ family response regulator